MRILSLPLLAGAALLGLAAATPAQAQVRALNDPVVAHPDPESLFTSPDPKLHRNKQTALHIMRELLQCNQWDRAGEWLTDRYIQHNPMAASGLESVQNFFLNVMKVKPAEKCDKLTNPIVAVSAENDIVVVLIKREMPLPGSTTGETYTTTWFDAWRFVDGKADQHWDPATLAAPAAPAAAPAAAGASREQDRVAIEKLMWDYVRAADPMDADAYAQLFTEDGSFGNTKGRDALRKMISDMKARQSGNEGEPRGNMHHIMSNQYIEFTGPDTARVHYYWQTVFGGPGTSPAPRVAAVGNGVDDVVKVNGRWLIRSRNVQPSREME